MERIKTNDISQWVEIDATPPPSVGSVSVKISPDVTSGGDRIATLDIEQAEDIDENTNCLQLLEPR